MSNKAELLNEAVQCITRLHEIARDIAELEKAETLSGVYILRSGEYYKIGASYDIWNRVKQLQVGNPLPLEMVKIIRCAPDDLEDKKKHVHSLFESKRYQGDWFRLSAADIQQMDKEGLYISYDLFIRLKNIFRGVTVQIEPIHNEEMQQLEEGIFKPRDRMRLMIDLIRDLELSGPVPIETILERAERELPIDRNKAEEIIQRLKLNGQVFEPRSGFIKSLL